MSSSHDVQFSRRAVLASSLAIPLIGGASAQANHASRAQGDNTPDPVVSIAAAWIAKRQDLEAMIFEWQRVEKQLIKRAKALEVAINDARGPRFPEETVMRSLDRRIDVSYAVLENLAIQASCLQAVSVEGALAKMDLGVRVQGRYGWQPYALDLLETGDGELRALLRHTAV